MPGTQTADSLHLLLERAVDYAGLFPPAALGMREAVRNYAKYSDSAQAWMLGRFVVPVTRLQEFADAYAREAAGRGSWLLSALFGDDAREDSVLVAEFNRGHAGRVTIDTCEVKVSSPAQIASVAGVLGRSLRCFCEVPLSGDLRAFAVAAAAAGFGIKARTGGITREAFPRPGEIVRFLRAAVDARVPFKLTAGLHHPLTGEYRLTYEPGSPRGEMFGFLTVFLAAALLRGGGSDQQAIAVLGESDAAAFRFDADGVRWNGILIGVNHISESRRQFAGFGSCSFSEPVEELAKLGLLA